MSATDRYAEEVISPGDQASRVAKEVGFKTHDYNHALTVFPLTPGNFRGQVGLSLKPHLLRMMLDNYNSDDTPKDTWTLIEVPQNDGCGGKPQFISLVNTEEAYRRIGHDLVAMAADDLKGACPTYMVNEINCRYINETSLPLFQAVMDGYLEALGLAGMTNPTGETAILRDQLTAFSEWSERNQLIFTWGATCHGLLHREQNLADKFITGEMPIVGFFENGYRCNGGGLLTNLALGYYGSVHKICDSAEAMAFVDKLTTPSVIHCRMLAEVMGWQLDDATFIGPQVDVLALAHITGGGLLKLQEALPAGIGAHLDKMPIPPAVLLEAQEMSWHDKIPDDLRITDERAHTSLNGGCGMMAVVPDPAEAGKLIMAAKPYGIRAEIIGYTELSPDKEISVVSQFGRSNGQMIYPLEKKAA